MPLTSKYRPDRLKIAYWSPLNPCKSGISDYSEQLLLRLTKYADIDIFIDDYVPATQTIIDQFPIHNYQDYPALASSRRYDVNLYQMGNSPFHEYMYKSLLNTPGLVVLHDYILQGFFYYTTAALGQRDRYLDEVEYNEGHTAREQVEQELIAGELDTYAYPLNRRVIKASLGLVVHSQWMKKKLTARGVTRPIRVIPMGVNVFERDPKRNVQLRASLGLSPDALIIGCFGRITMTKHIAATVRAFNRLHQIYPRSILLLVGEPNTLTADYLQETTARYGITNSVQITGYVPGEIFDSYLQISDICVNLRYPSAGETSRTLCQALAAGVPVLASNIDAFTDFPDNCVWKVDVGVHEQDELTAYLLELAFHPDLRRQMGQNAQDYVLANATWPQVAGEYAAFLAQTIASARK